MPNVRHEELLKAAFFACFGAAILGWLILLGGISGVQNSYGTNVRSVLGLPWFILCLQLVVLLLLQPSEVPHRSTPSAVSAQLVASTLVTAGVQVSFGVYHLAPGTPCSRRYALHRSDGLLVQRTRLPASYTRPHKCDHGRQAVQACQQTRANCTARIDSIRAHHIKVVCVHLPRGLH